MMKKMKRLKKMVGVLLSAIMVLAMALPVMATDTTATTGSIKILEKDSVSLENKAFKAYRILDATLAGTDNEGKPRVAYTVPEKLRTYYATKFGVDEKAKDFDVKITKEISELSETELFDFAKNILASTELKTNITGVEGTYQKGDKNAYIISGLPLGYYVVADETEYEAGTPSGETAISALILDTLVPDAEITVKADVPTIDKKIISENGTDEPDKVEYNNAAIGDIVNYEITSKVPDMTGYKHYCFVVTDTLSHGLTYQNDLKIMVGGKEYTSYTPTITEGDLKTTPTIIKIVFNKFIELEKDQDIIIKYSAKVNDSAVIGAQLGNPNDVNLTYSNDPNKTSSGDPDEPNENSPVGITPDKTTRTYLTGLKLLKVDGKTEAALAGAEFEIKAKALNQMLVNKDVFEVDNEKGTYYKLKDGTYTIDVPTEDTERYYEDTETKYTKTSKQEIETATGEGEEKTYKATVDNDGILRLTGLAAGTYIITEAKAPNGYNMLDKDIIVELKWSKPAEEGDTDCIWTGTKDGEAISAVEDNDFHFTFKVANNTGTELPSTGGIGTTIFYIVGGILVVGAAILLVTKKRMSKEI